MIEQTDNRITVYNDNQQPVFHVLNPALGKCTVAIDAPYKSFNRNEIRQIAQAMILITNNASLW